MIKTTKDANLRNAARRRGFILQKRRPFYCAELQDGYMIRSASSGAVIKGEYYELTPEEVREFLNEYEGGRA